MRRLIFIGALLSYIAIGLTAHSQVNPEVFLRRQGMGLAYGLDNTTLSPARIQVLLNEDQWQLYQKGHAQKVAAIPLFALSSVGLTGGLAYTGVSVYNALAPSKPSDPYHPTVPMGWAMGPAAAAVGYGIALLAGIPAIVLNHSGNKKLNAVAKDYNQARCPQLAFELSPAGTGIAINF